MVAAKELGSERVSNERGCMSQLGTERVSKSLSHPPRCFNVVGLATATVSSPKVTKALTRIWSEQVFGISGQIASASIETPASLGRYFPDPCDNLRCLNDLLSLLHVGRQTALRRN
jgi:hypothetical protein